MMMDTLWKLMLHSHVTMDILFLEMTQQYVKHQASGVNNLYVQVKKLHINVRINVNYLFIYLIYIRREPN